MGLRHALLVLPTLAACGLQTVRLMADDHQLRDTAAYVTARRYASGGTEVHVEAYRLPGPARLPLDATTLVVWSRAWPSAARRLGALDLRQSGDPSTQDGTLRATVAEASFDLFITGEPTADVSEPSARRLMWATVSAK